MKFHEILMEDFMPRTWQKSQRAKVAREHLLRRRGLQVKGMKQVALHVDNGDDYPGSLEAERLYHEYKIGEAYHAWRNLYFDYLKSLAIEFSPWLAVFAIGIVSVLPIW